MIHYMIDLVGVFIGSGILEYAIYPIFCLGFLCTVPCLIRRIVGG